MPRSWRLYGGVFVFFVLAGLAAAGPVTTGDETVFFETRIRPLLAENCVSCHGEKTRHGGLRLDTRAGFEKGGDRGPLLLAAPGDVKESLLLRAVRHEAGSVKMPPGGKLAPEQIADLTAWVGKGAPWPEAARPAASFVADAAFPYPAESRKFWSFAPVRNPPVPRVKNRAWRRSPLDAFILAELEKRGLRPAPPADRPSLLRRVTLDLTGLPPTPAQVRAFVADPSPNAYANVVDRLLASPRYGERWGRHWLDLVRYADSLDARGIGGEGDIREAWRYRDWVVQAFNRDLPYDQFVQNQIAGDLLPPPAGQDFNAAGTIATGMLAIGEWGNGDADKDKILTDIADDQVDVVSRGFLGLTVSCARCHDHKFDPIPTRDYYGLAGIFFSSHILPNLTPKGQGENPLRIPLASTAAMQRRALWQSGVDEREKRLKTTGDAHRSVLAKELLPQTARYLAAAWEYARRSATAPVDSPPALASWAKSRGLHVYALRQWLAYLGLGDYRSMTVPLRDVLGMPNVRGWKSATGDTPSLLVNANADARTLLTFTLPGRSVAVHPGPSAGVAVGWISPITGTVQLTGRVTDADPNGGDGVAWIVDLRRGASSAGPTQLAFGDLPNGGAAQTLTGRLQSISVRPGDQIQLLVLPKQNHGFDTTRVELTITEVGHGPQRLWNLARDLVGEPDRRANSRLWDFYDLAGSSRMTASGAGEPETPLSQWQQAVAANGGAAAAAVVPLDRVRSASEAFARTFDLADARSPFWPSPSDDGDAALPPNAQTELAVIAGELAALRKNAPPVVEYAHGAQEGGCPGSPHAGVHDVRIHVRGSYARLGETVPRHFPVVLAGERQPPIPPGRSGRLELARWLTAPTNPLTPRVLVNRVWQHHFGRGIVRTPSNFGVLGERPTHPELLDYLASDFTKHGWSLKRLHRLILLSATYRQTSEARPETLRTDPDNRLWGRANRRRLESEAIRDSLLAASGTLDPTLGGPALPADLASPRRTLYLRTVRSDRAGFGPLFDAANAASSVDQRTISTIAPQALFLLNNPFVLDQARIVALRLTREAPGTNEAARIRRAYLLLYGRSPAETEIAVGRAFLARARGKKTTDALAWERYAHLLICANEFVYVD